MTRPSPRGGVEDHYVTDAAEYLNILSPRNDLWSDDPPRWIYRGQANAEWALKAKAVRDHALFAKYGVQVASFRPGYTPPPVPDGSDRAGLQRRMLLRFRQGLDRQGLAIPTASPRVHSDEFKPVRTSSVEPPREAFPLLALAQHHGLPTMLLDWTRRAWVGAYFAAVVAADKETRGDATALSVWALERGDLKEPAEGPSFYDAPGDTNPNLHAQAGLFTWLSTSEDDPSLEEHFVRIKKITGRTPRLRRISLPVSESGKLLRLLSHEGIDGASLFPGADGVVRAMRESALWDIPSR